MHQLSKISDLNFIICKIHVNNMKIGNHFKQSHSMSNSYLHEKFILIFKFILKFKRNAVLKFYSLFLSYHEVVISSVYSSEEFISSKTLFFSPWSIWTLLKLCCYFTEIKLPLVPLTRLVNYGAQRLGNVTTHLEDTLQKL